MPDLAAIQAPNRPRSLRGFRGLSVCRVSQEAIHDA